jgi:uncharacterized tellurite resistance protein B-like protein
MNTSHARFIRLYKTNHNRMEHQTRKIKAEHLNSLIAMAYSDGILDESEKEFLIEKADEIDMPREELWKIVENADQLEFLIPQNMVDREEQLTDCVYIMMMDGEIHEKEYDLCLKVAQKLDLDKHYLDHAIELTKKLWGG